jgi:carbon-monoxide dehydrogenase large subunit
VHALEDHPAPHNPLGAKGAGEGGIIPVGGVIANAVAAALQRFDVRPNALPLTPARVWAMIEDSNMPQSAGVIRSLVERGDEDELFRDIRRGG